MGLNNNKSIHKISFMKMLDNGHVLVKKKEYEKGILWYDKVIKIYPKWAGPYLHKGIALLKLSRYYEAICCFDKSLKTRTKLGCPIQVGTQYNKGRALYHLARYNEALCCYDKAYAGLLIGSPLKSLNSKGLASRIFILKAKTSVLKKLKAGKRK